MTNDPQFTSPEDESLTRQITENLARVLKELRSEKNLTQHDLTDRSGLSLRMISDMERGLKQPTLITLHKLARGFDMPVISFMERILPTKKP